MLFKKKIAIETVKQTINNEIQKMNSTTCCFTGHRNQKLPWGYNEQDERCLMMIDKTKSEIEKAILNGYDTFISGMAIGFDMICAEILLELKRKYTHIKIVGALPCKTQDNRWSDIYKKRYRSILKQLDKIRCIHDSYIDGCMQERNEYMINNSSLCIALYNGLSGGTQSTIKYAKDKGLQIIIIKP